MSVSRFFLRHPVLRDAMRWALPALLLGLVLRVMLMSYLPYGYWGSDSKSYYGLAHKLLTLGEFDNDPKRRYLYPLLMVPVSVLPGSPLRWLPWCQHLLGLLSVLPLAYVVRKTMPGWRLWIIPATLLYALQPMFLWYEHELLGEVVFFSGFAWAFAGWVAWTSEKDPVRARRLFWLFLIPLAAFLLTKPAGRFLLPGICVGLLMVRAWRVLDWVRWSALAGLAAVTMTVGSGKQGAWLLYTASFPLTRLDTPLHAEYKADIRERVQEQASQLDLHYLNSRAAQDFLESPSKNGGTPRWAALDKDTELERKIYMDLALEGIRAQPLTYGYLALQRLTASANLSGFEESRFLSDYYPNRFQRLYEEAARQLEERKGKLPPSLPRAFGLPANGPLPPFEEFRMRLAPSPGCWTERTVFAMAKAYDSVSDIVKLPPTNERYPAEVRSFKNTTVRPLGWWLFASLLLSLYYWRTLGVWVVASVGYLCGVYLCALVQTRFFLPAYLVFFPVLFVPLDLLYSRLTRPRAKTDENAGC